MMTLFGEPTVWLPLVFASLMGLSILIYVVLDGYDLGVGILLPFATDAEKDMMIASIGPFWDANETWLVLAVGLLLVAFPIAHGTVLVALYVPVALMLAGLILRGVAFEFRIKAPAKYKSLWNRAFAFGSALTALTQGFMLGLYIMGLEYSFGTVVFALITALCLAAGYSFIGSGWLLIKTEDALQKKAVGWARTGLIGAAAGFVAISLASPLVSPRIFDKWFSMPELFLLAPLPILSVVVFGFVWRSLGRLPQPEDRGSWHPFAGAMVLFTLAFAGLAYSFYPYVVPEKLTIFEAASAPESLIIMLVGALLVLPAIIGYSALAYTVFRGKATALSYH